MAKPIIEEIFRPALAHVATAASLVRAARAAFGENEEARPDLADVSEVAVCAKTALAAATNELFSISPSQPLEGAAQAILCPLYNTLDVLIVTVHAMKSCKPPTGEGTTICPIAGALAVVIGRLEQASAALATVIGGSERLAA